MDGPGESNGCRGLSQFLSSIIFTLLSLFPAHFDIPDKMGIERRKNKRRKGGSTTASNERNLPLFCFPAKRRSFLDRFSSSFSPSSPEGPNGLLESALNVRCLMNLLLALSLLQFVAYRKSGEEPLRKLLFGRKVVHIASATSATLVKHFESYHQPHVDTEVSSLFFIWH